MIRSYTPAVRFVSIVTIMFLFLFSQVKFVPAGIRLTVFDKFLLTAHVNTLTDRRVHRFAVLNTLHLGHAVYVYDTVLQ